MSNVDSTQQPKTLEEALQEIDSLRAQLSGSDLKVFSQNRELRVENQKLKEEIRQFTEQCVTQTFKVRGLEKAEEKLQTTLSDAQSKIEDLETQVTELGGTVEEVRSKEVQLSQELENAVRSNSEAVEKMLAEHSQEVEAKSAEYEAELATREKAIQELEQRVEQFKEEFLSQDLTLEPVASEDTSQDTGAFELLSQKMEDFLGFPGRALVEQVFRLCGVETSSTSPSELEETFEVLQDTASQLVQDDEQEQELSTLLESAWKELGLGGPVDAAEPAEVAAPDEAAEPEEVAEAAEPEEAAAPAEVAEEVDEEPEPTVEEAPAVSTEEPADDSSATAEPAEEADSAEEPEEETGESSQAPENEEFSVTEAPSTEEPEAPATDEVAEAPYTEEEESTEEPTTEEPETAPAEAVDPPIAEQTETESAEEPPAEEPEAEVPAEVAEAPSTEEAESTEEPATEEPSEPVEESSTEDAEVAPEESAEPETAPADEVEAVAEEPVEEPEISETSEASAEEVPESPEPQEDAAELEPVVEVVADFDLAATHLEDGQHAEALPIFELLQKDDPNEPTYQIGRLACLAGLSRFEEAFEVGKALEGTELGDSHDVFLESMEAAIIGVASEAESDIVKKEYLLELLLRARPDDQIGLYLDEADEIPMRISREGELSFLQATHRVSQDDVTEYLIDALHSLHNKPSIFALLKTNLERYPELQPLSEFMERLLDSPRAEALEAESSVRDLLGQGESVEDLLDETDPGEEAVVQVFLEHMLPRSGVVCDIPSEEFEELMLDAEPAAFVGSLRQALRSVDYTVFFEEIEVLSYDGDDHFLLRSSPEPKPTLLFGEDLDDVPPEELRFLVLRELFSMYRRHSQLKHISGGLDDQKRVELVRACIDIFSEFESKLPEDTYQDLEILKGAAQAEGQDADFRAKLEAFLRQVYLATESDSFLELGDFLYNEQLNRKWLDPIADNFGAKQTGMVVASYAICRDALESEEFEEMEEGGFGWLYSEENLEKHADLRLRLQRLWSSPLKALISEPEE
jgi:archaellum component FlaC